MKRHLNCAVIGTRFGARTILPALSKFDNVNIKYILGGSNLEKTKLIAESFSIKNYNNNFDEIISDSSLDAIFIATPHNTHYEMIKKSLNKQINIITEKPLATSMKDVLFLANASEENSKINIVNHQLRFLPIFLAIKNILKDGLIGEVNYIKINYQTNRLSDPNIKWNWCLDEKSGGGMIIAMGSHLIDLVKFFSEKDFLSLSSYTNCLHDEVEDINKIIHKVNTESLFELQLNLENNIRANIFCTGTSHQEDFLEINLYGKYGEIYYHSINGAYLYNNNSVVDIFNKFNIPKNNLSIWKESFNNFTEALIESIKFDSLNKDFITFKDYSYYYYILESAKESAKNNKTIKLKDRSIYEQI